MDTKCLLGNNEQVQVVSLNTVVVGSGAAGFAAAARLWEQGQKDIAIVTEGVNMGTSRNTGSDKQTYYKMSLCGDCPDSTAEMAQDLFAGKCVDGDLAMAEAANSVPCFLHLCELGVPFPMNRYGEYVGYKTDHDARTRATSAGPLTSKLMTEALEVDVQSKAIPIYDRHMAVEVLTRDGKAIGLLTLNMNNDTYTLFNCRNIVYATGGPAGIYADSVYPCGHTGSSGVAFRAGVTGRNLTEWQYGLASTKPRWNVSGTYMQVLPRFVSVDEHGQEYDFVTEYFGDEGKSLSMIFQKGYEWPFDCRKVMNGSSIIDLLVYKESVLKKRRVFLDFRRNPGDKKSLDFSLLSEESSAYLNQAGACFGTPLERLLHMNAPAYELYLSKGVDLKTEMLEIALCAQHNNGGLAVDLWWQTNVQGLFAVGEAAGTHGVYRPGGSALNAGQVGALRAARFISVNRQGQPLPMEAFVQTAQTALETHRAFCEQLLSLEDNTGELLHQFSTEMSAVGAAIRNEPSIKAALQLRREWLEHFTTRVHISSKKALPRAYRLWDMLVCQVVYLSAMEDYRQTDGGSRGSALYTDTAGNVPCDMEEMFCFLLDNGKRDKQLQEITYDGNICNAQWRAVNPLPESGGFFENVWREYRKNQNVF